MAPSAQLHPEHPAGVRAATPCRHSELLGGRLQAHTSFCPHQVVGVKDSLMGEEICACIRLRAGQSCAADDIKAFCKGKVRSAPVCPAPVSCLATMTSSSWRAAHLVPAAPV